MSEMTTEVVKRWTAKRKWALVIGIIQGKITVAGASWLYPLARSELENKVDHARTGMKNGPRVRPLDVRQQHDKVHCALQEACGEAMFGLSARKSWGPSCRWWCCDDHHAARLLRSPAPYVWVWTDEGTGQTEWQVKCYIEALNWTRGTGHMARTPNSPRCARLNAYFIWVRARNVSLPFLRCRAPRSCGPAHASTVGSRLHGRSRSLWMPVPRTTLSMCTANGYWHLTAAKLPALSSDPQHPAWTRRCNYLSTWWPACLKIRGQSLCKTRGTSSDDLRLHSKRSIIYTNPCVP